MVNKFSRRNCLIGGAASIAVVSSTSTPGWLEHLESEKYAIWKRLSDEISFFVKGFGLSLREVSLFDHRRRLKFVIEMPDKEKFVIVPVPLEMSFSNYEFNGKPLEPVIARAKFEIFRHIWA